jgi:polyisoprenoid-binding protein YceI
VPLPPGSHTFGPDNATLSIHTKRTGAAAKAGHNLHFHVTHWDATLAVGDDPSAASIELRADGASLKVIEGEGGMQTLDDENRADIEKTIDDEVLRRQTVTFHSARATPNGDGLTAEGELTLNGATHPLAVALVTAGDGRIRATATVRQSDWGMKPYSTLFGALKVVDDVVVELTGGLAPGDQSA